MTIYYYLIRIIASLNNSSYLLLFDKQAVPPQVHTIYFELILCLAARRADIFFFHLICFDFP